MFENNEFPDSDSDATDVKVFKENIEDAAAIADVEGKEVDEVDVRTELREGNKSNENYLNDLFKKYCFSLSLLIIEISISMLRIVYFNKLIALKLIPFLIIIFVSGSLFKPL